MSLHIVVYAFALHNYIHTQSICITYRIAGFYHEDFNIAFGSIRNIKICVIFVKRNILW